MKYTLVICFFILSKSLFSQQNDNITVLLPKKAIWALAYQISQRPTVDSFAAVRKLPDTWRPLVGSDNEPDSLINITLKARILAGFILSLEGDKNGAVRDFYRSVMLNMPSIGGYTGLIAQINARAAANGADKAAATYVRDEVIKYQGFLQNNWTQELLIGQHWIKN